MCVVGRGVWLIRPHNYSVTISLSSATFTYNLLVTKCYLKKGLYGLFGLSYRLSQSITTFTYCTNKTLSEGHVNHCVTFAAEYLRNR